MASLDILRAIRPLGDDDRERLRRVVEEHGEDGAARLTGLSKTSIYRALAGLGLTPGTRELVARGCRGDAPRSVA